MAKSELITLTVAEAGIIKRDVAAFSDSDLIISQIANDYMALKIIDSNDTEGYNSVDQARKRIKRLRLQIEERRKDLKEFPIAHGRAIDAEASRLTELIAPIELHLKDSQGAIDLIRAQEKAEKQREKHRQLMERLSKLAEIGVTDADASDINEMDDFAWMVFFKKSNDAATEKREEAAREALAQVAREALAQSEREAEREAERVQMEAEREWLRVKAMEAEEAIAQAERDRKAAWDEFNKLKLEAQQEREATEKKLAIENAERDLIRDAEEKKLRDELEKNKAVLRDVQASIAAKQKAEREELDRKQAELDELDRLEKQAAIDLVEEEDRRLKSLAEIEDQQKVSDLLIAKSLVDQEIQLAIEESLLRFREWRESMFESSENVFERKANHDWWELIAAQELYQCLQKIEHRIRSEFPS